MAMGSNDSCIVYAEVFPDPSTGTASKVFFALVYSLIFLLGFTGNLAVIVVTARLKSLQTVQNLFIINLSVSDLVVCLLSVPFTPIANIYKQWFFGSGLCHLIPWSQGTSIFVQTFSLTAIAVNRYALILKPHLPPLSRKFSLALIFAIWVVSSVLTVPYGYYMRIHKYEDLCGEFCTEDWSSDDVRLAYTLSVFAAQFLLPAALISLAYGCILSSLRQRTNRRLHSMQTGPPRGLAEGETSVSLPSPINSPSLGPEQRLHYVAQRTKLLHHKRRTTIILICMVGVFILAWLPYQIINLLIEFRPHIFVINQSMEEDGADLQFVVMTLTHAFAMTSILANPFVYAWLNLTFRQTILKALGRRQRKHGVAAPCPLPHTDDGTHLQPSEDLDGALGEGAGGEGGGRARGGVSLASAEVKWVRRLLARLQAPRFQPRSSVLSPPSILIQHYP